MADGDPKLFKDRLAGPAIDRLAGAVAQAFPSFDAAAFKDAGHAGLEELELLQRVVHIGEALRRHLPADFESVAAILSRVAALWPTALPDQGGGAFSAWPLFHVVPAAGLHDLELGLETLRRLTPLWSAEAAIRPFLGRYGSQAFGILERWVEDPDPHVRRLVSEGTRPRLPWATRVPCLSDDPLPGLALLDRLVDDESDYVRRSVANHLNDVSRDWPTLAIETATRWRARETPGRTWIVRHGLRTLIKAGDTRAFALLGHEAEALVDADKLEISPSEVPFGGRLVLQIDLTASKRAEGRQRLVVDFAIGFAGARGPLRRKVFKGAGVDLGPGETRTLRFSFDFKPITTRRYYPGDHTAEIVVNGRPVASGAFTLAPPPPPP